MNPMQKYPHVIELSACIPNMFVLMFLCSINLLISLGTCSTPKESKQVISLLFTSKAIQCVLTSSYSSRFITYAPFCIVLSKLFLK